MKKIRMEKAPSQREMFTPSTKEIDELTVIVLIKAIGAPQRPTKISSKLNRNLIFNSFMS